MSKIVAFTGPAGIGKTTAARYLVTSGLKRKPKLDLYVQSFAQPIKGMVRGLIETVNRDKNYATKLVNDPEMKEQPIPELGGFTARHLMQTLGTEWGRDAVAKDFWVKIAIIRFERSMKKNIGMVFDDLRFQNEADMVRALGGLVIGLRGRDTSTESTGHASENSFPEPDFWIDNTGDEAALHAAIDEVIDTRLM